MPISKKIILASKSPRRQQMIKEMGFDYEIRTMDVEETYPSTLVREQIPIYLAKLKANSFEGKLAPDEILITADTIVWLNNEVLQKPVDFEDAVRILTALSGNMHEVFTGVCLKSDKKQKTFHAESKVYFKNLTREEIEYYVLNYKPFDKAGAYGIQEWIGYIGIKHIEGSFYNVMGLPTGRLYEELMEF